ncbi:ankyrin repeat domain-containing protein [Exiguobacterium sp. SH3S1]|uniref:ankyrin repeat domain-containing protein n=1 Tax=Exiguobacterium sp. SH3S1 TaxID=2510955 RepID=UPI00103D33FF|nr:ankyrin repeat domain-containing protein [Exiguobacterium sp. SH3S1]TCI60813.1 hypothetical protein EVJ26_11110 [Exiguobacterium sp. SH3S1]
MIYESNYDFLEREWPDYANLGLIIETKLASNPEQAVLKMKVLSELLVHNLLEKHNTQPSSHMTTENRLNSIQELENVPREIAEKLRLLREVDHTASLSKQHVYSLNEQLVELMHWFATTYGTIEYGPLRYIEPVVEDKELNQFKHQLALYEVNYADLEDDIANESSLEISQFTRTGRDRANQMTETTSMTQNTKKPKGKFKRALIKLLITSAVVLLAFLGINAYTLAQNYEAFPSSLDRTLVKSVNGVLGYSYGENAMNKAMEQKDSDRIEYLLTQSVDKNKLYFNGETLSTYAVKEGDNKLLLSLLEDSADMSKQNVDGETALEIAYEMNNERALNLLGTEKTPLSVNFVQNNLIGYWKSIDDEVIELQKKGDTVSIVVYIEGKPATIDLSKLSVVNKEILKLGDKQYSKSASQESKRVLAAQVSASEESVGREETPEDEVEEQTIEEIVTETEEEPDSQAELEALLAEREEEEMNRLKKNVTFMNSIVGFWQLSSEWKDERYYTLVIEETQEDRSWGFYLLNEGKILPSSSGYNYYYRESILLENNKVELPESDGSRYVVTKVSDTEITVNLEVGTDSFGKIQTETFIYKKIPKNTVSTELLKEYPNAFK